MDMLDWQMKASKVVIEQDIYTWLDDLEKDVKALKASYSASNRYSESVGTGLTNVLVDLTMVAELMPVDLSALANSFLRGQTMRVCGLCPGGVPLLKGRGTCYDETPHYYCPACKCIYPLNGSLKEVRMVTKEEIGQRIIELKNLKSIAMTAPGRQAVEDAIVRLTKRLKDKEV
jgi:hypothetical protein